MRQSARTFGRSRLREIANTAGGRNDQNHDSLPCSCRDFFFASVPSVAVSGHRPRRIEVVAKRFAFEPASIDLQKGVAVTLVLKSVDIPHGIRFRELNVEVKASKGGSGEVESTSDKTGDFVDHCSVLCGAGHG
jgi:heme/copper-type cytochrome/quinol oxidase subunit 2